MAKLCTSVSLMVFHSVAWLSAGCPSAMHAIMTVSLDLEIGRIGHGISDRGLSAGACHLIVTELKMRCRRASSLTDL